MTSSPEKPRDNLPFLALDLAPEWAQGPRTKASSQEQGESHADGAAARDARRGRRPPDARGTAGGGRHVPHSRHPTKAFASDSRRDGHRRPPPGDGRDQAGRSESLYLPLSVHFVPAQHGMEFLAGRLAASRRAFPLGKLTAMFLSRPEALVVRLTSEFPDAVVAGKPADGVQEKRESAENRVPLHQCRLCRAVYLEKGSLAEHLLSRHTSSFYDVNQVEIDPPAGNFVCIARCGISGELVGPPNYHAYHERLTELHRERFAHIAFDTYRSKLEMCRDAEVINAWRESMRVRTVYLPIRGAASKKHARVASSGEAPGDGAGDGDSDGDSDGERLEDANAMRRHFMLNYYRASINECFSCVIPGPIARRLEDEKLRSWIDTVWRREARSIMRTAITVRGVFRSLGFSAFKTADQRSFMTAIVPRSLKDAEAVDTVKRILEYVNANPGCSRAALWEDLAADAASPAGSNALRHFQWLVEKGRLIYFHDGTLVVPAQLHAVRPPTSRRGGRKRKHPAKLNDAPR